MKKLVANPCCHGGFCTAEAKCNWCKCRFRSFDVEDMVVKTVYTASERKEREERRKQELAELREGGFFDRRRGDNN